MCLLFTSRSRSQRQMDFHTDVITRTLLRDYPRYFRTSARQTLKVMHYQRVNLAAIKRLIAGTLVTSHYPHPGCRQGRHSVDLSWRPRPRPLCPAWIGHFTCRCRLLCHNLHMPTYSRVIYSLLTRQRLWWGRYSFSFDYNFKSESEWCFPRCFKNTPPPIKKFEQV